MANQLIPEVEKRISSWIEIQEKRKTQEMAGALVKSTITISRQFGCEGYPLAAKLKEILDEKTQRLWTIIDNQFVDKLANDSEISKHLIKNIGERSKYLDYIISSLIPNWKSETEVFKMMVETIYSVAQQGDAIILERGAFAISKNLPNCFHFRLIAPMEYRADSYARRKKISIEKAEKLVREKEQDRTSFLAHFLNCQFDQENFHLIINNGKYPIENIAKLIVSYIEA